MLERFLFWRRNPDPGMELPQPNPDPGYADGPAREPRIVTGEAHLTASLEEIMQRAREARDRRSAQPPIPRPLDDREKPS